VDLGHGDWVQASLYHRRNKDDYAFSRTAPLGPVHPFQHTTKVTGLALDGRNSVGGDITIAWRAEHLEDKIASTSLTFGPYRDRALDKLAVVPEKTIGQTTIRGGVTYDHSDRDGSTFSPVVGFVQQDGAVRWHADYSRATQVPSYTALKSSPTSGLFRGNQNLGREVAHQAEVGASTTAAGWTLEGAVFWRRDDSLVDWTFRRGVTARSANPVDIDTAGFEAVARHAWKEGEVVFGYTALTKDADYRGAAVDASFYALNYAKHRFTAAVTWRLGAGFELRMDNVARIQADNLLRVTGGNNAVTSSLGLAYRPAEWHGVALSVQADNLWNTSFQEVPAVPAARRTVTGGVSYAW
jgi:outer membrane cobalamin receptor